MVNSGDTFKVRHNGRQERIRLYGVESPAMQQPFGRAARQVARRMLTGKKVQVESIFLDTYRHNVSIVKLGDLTLNEEMVRLGYAWVNPENCRKPVCKAWQAVLDEARTEKTGLWRQKNPVPPWLWRAKEKEQ